MALKDQRNQKFIDKTILSSDGTSELFVRHYGVEKPKLHFILVHGALEHSGRHLDLVQFLLTSMGQGVAVTTWDHVGHGRSGGVRAYVSHFKVYVDDMGLISDEVQSWNSEETKTFILAHSLGGLITLTRILDTTFGWKYPLHGLIFSSPCIRPQMVLGSSSESVLKKLDKMSGKIHLPIIYHGKDLSRDPERANDFDSDNLIPNFISVRMAREVVEASQKIRGLSYYLNIPSLFLIAQEDKVVDPESTLLFSHGIEKKLNQTCLYPGHYHELWNEIDRFDIFETMKRWIEKRLKESA
jgi:alpha-beta hydrolase superfamily lysophospholipase